jgi:microcystin-dependent protein
MATPYIGEVRMVGFSFAPVGWALCNGQSIPISQNNALFNLIGTTYGGDGVNTFNLPNLQSRIPFHQGTNSQGTMVIGQIAGSETVTLTTSQLPAHTHILAANSGSGTQAGPTGGVWAGSTLNQFSTATNSHTMDPSTITATGGSQPHDNMPPFLVINFIVALDGIYPTQN